MICHGSNSSVWGGAGGGIPQKPEGNALCSACFARLSNIRMYASTLGKLVPGKLDMVHAAENLPGSMRICALPSVHRCCRPACRPVTIV